MTPHTHPRGVSALLATLVRGIGRVALGAGALSALAVLLLGVPWGLIRFVGWPLPEHVPSLTEITTWLWYGHFHTGTLLDVLALACWAVWAVFTRDVARSLIEAARGIRWPHAALPEGPTRLVASLLVGGLLLAVGGHRLPGTSTAVVATAHANTTGIVATTHHQLDRPTATVARPADGVHDSLWHIAERRLDSPARWPDIWRLNKHRVQNDGRVFTNPHLIQPGWTLRLPAKHLSDRRPDTAAAPEPDTTAEADVATGEQQHRPAAGPARPPAATATPDDDVESRDPDTASPTLPGPDAEPHDPGDAPETTVLVSLGLLAAISAAVVIARQRYRRRHGPGADLPVAPFAYDLHLAHLHTQQATEVCDETSTSHDAVEATTVDGQSGGARVVVARPTERVTLAADAATPPASVSALGVRDGVELALDLAATGGLGLLGEGAVVAARALLVTTLADHPGTATVLIPADAAAEFVGTHTKTRRAPAGLRIVADVDAALTEIDNLTTQRARATSEEPFLPVLLIARPPRDTQRLTDVLAYGARYGVTGVFLGQYPAQVCAYVAADGTVTATPPGTAEPLRGARLYQLPRQASEVLDLLRDADPATAGAPLDVARPASDDAGAGAGMCDPAPSLTILHPTRTEPTADATPLPDAAPTAPAGAITDDIRGGEAAVDAPKCTPDGPLADTGDNARLEISVFGPMQVHYRPPGDADSTVDITDALAPKHAELLLFLALHPEGAPRAAITDTIWQKPATRVGNVFSTTLSRTRAALASATDDTVTDAVLTTGGRYLLNPDVVTVDYWDFAAAVAARRTTTTEDERAAANHAIVDAYRGPLADGLPVDWVEGVREAARRDAVNAVSALARHLHHSDPQHTLDLLELARSFDPYNDRIYCDIMRLQARLGHPDAISRTLTLLRTRLTEIRERPDPATIQLATALIARAHTTPAESR